ncbi:MAG: SDR family oxidoreductase [Candidatus Wallbacteria bacterium]|nr:SDR family oxidoreductase [Candidatus Wallbacteria bacterium]
MASSNRPLALVTGASAGIGEAFARKLAARGHDLVLVARRADRLEALAAELAKQHGAKTQVEAMDLGKPETPRELFSRVKAPLDLLVNNAGYGTAGLFHEQDYDRELGQIDLNARALVALTHLFVPAMVQRRSGAVINLGSIGSFMSCPNMATYAATKAFILSFSEAIAHELQEHGVHVMCVCPGGTSTEFQQVAGVEVKDIEWSFMTAEAVVDIALADLDARRKISISGLMNKLTVRAAWLLPRGLMSKAIHKGFAGRKK